MQLTKLPCIVALVFTCYTSVAQSLPEYKVYSNEEVNLKSCPFDPEADAVELFHIAKGSHNDEYNLIQTHHVRIKVLNKNGIKWGTVAIPYYRENEFEYITNIEGAVMNVQENGSLQIKEIKRSDVYDERIDKKIGVMKFALPNVKAGSIIEYKYTSTCKHYGGLRDWYFQSAIPTMNSSYSLVILPGYEFSYVLHKSSAYPVKIDQDKGTGTVTFTMNQIPGLDDEPFMDAPKDYLQRVEFQMASYTGRFGSKTNYITKWEDVIRELMPESYFGKAIDKQLAAAEVLINQAKGLTTAFQKLSFLHSYLRKNFTFTGRNSIYAMDGLKSIWENKKGNSGELNLLLLNLLKYAGVESYPLLASERDNGRVQTEVPMLDQFNKVVACVIADGTRYIVDASDEFTPTNMVPYNLLNTHAFLMKGRKGEIIKVIDDLNVYRNTISVNATVQPTGKIDGSATVFSHAYARIDRSKAAKNQEKFVGSYFKKSKDIKIDSLQLLNVDNDTLPLEQDLKFQAAAEASGNFLLLDLNLFTGIEKNPFVASKRFTSINFGCRQVTSVLQNFLLPANYKVDGLPRNVRVRMPDNSLELVRTASVAGDKLVIELSFKINKTVFTPDEYSDVKEFYEKMASIINQQVVLRAM